ncbi:MAG TPA: alpha/beta hydrolase [Syntrophus sp. (in: bacteria)]|nr:MAG: alpha/beta hydrolase [Syntrophus sp. GWC2_56_31]HBB17811.1 alpha/beta hydrolase [Syntrophus sp. (in: bacteria)]
MKHQEGVFMGVRGAELYYQGWLPEGEVRAVLLIVHGLAEHSGRYMNVVNRFVPLGYAVYGIDHVGHGRSEGRRLYVERFADYTEPLKTYFDMVRCRQPDKPVFLVGHSMGGLIGALHLLAHQDDLAGAVLSGPAIKAPGNIPAGIIFVGRVLSVLVPGVGLVPPVDADGVCRDPAVVKAYLADPLVHRGKLTARLGAELIGAMEHVRAEANRITLPVLILQGGADRLVDPSGAQILYEKIASSDKKLVVYEGFFHEVFNEPQHDRVLTDVEQWLAAHILAGK